MKFNGDLERFTQGDCHILARAIHLRTGWPIHCFTGWDAPDGHAFIKMPDGRFLDVQGACSRRTLRRRWPGYGAIQPFTYEEIKNEWHPALDRYSYQRAGVIAERLLKELDVESYRSIPA